MFQDVPIFPRVCCRLLVVTPSSKADQTVSRARSPASLPPPQSLSNSSSSVLEPSLSLIVSFPLTPLAMPRWAAVAFDSNSMSASHGLPAAAPLVVVVGVMAAGVCAMLAMVIGLCALRNRVQSKDSSDGHNSPAKSSSGSTMQHKKCMNLSAKRLLSMKKMQNRGCESDEGGNDDGLSEVGERSALDSPMWQRSILMGERCEPPAFSGLILYDEHGNLVPELPWKSPRPAPHHHHHHPSPSLRQLMTAT